MSTKNAKMYMRSIAFEFDPFNSHEFPWVQHTVMTDTNGGTKKYCIVKYVSFFRATGFGFRATRILKLVFRRDTKICTYL